MRTWFAKWLGGIAVVVLSGCAGTYLLDNTVQSFSQLTAVPSAPTYRFDRLPSQQDPAQAQLESFADVALHQAGFRRDDANARYTVQVSGRIQQVLSPWADPWDGWGGWGYGRRHGGLMPRMESPWFAREVSVIVRDIGTNRVVYESHARNDGPWRDNAAIFPAMFQAAMQGFPNPPPGPRAVNVQLPA
jgi:hypothetical protein